MPLLLLMIPMLALMGTSMYMTYTAGRKQEAAQKAIGKYNAQQAENQARQERLDRAAEEKEERKAAQRRMASIENMYAASGVLVDGTSALDALAAQGAADELNVLNRNRVSENRAKQIETQGKLGLWESTVNAQMTRLKTNAALVDGAAGIFSIASSASGGMSARKGTVSTMGDGSYGGGTSGSSLFG